MQLAAGHAWDARRQGLLRVAVLAALAFVAAAGATPVRGQQIGVEVYNGSGHTVTVRVDDLVCHQRIFDGEILDQTAATVAACPNQDGAAAIAVADGFGHCNLADSATATFAFP